MIENKQKIAKLQAHVDEQFTSLQRSLQEVKVRMKISQSSSKSDLKRMGRSLQQLMRDLSAENLAREVGDSKTEQSIMQRVQALVNELSRKCHGCGTSSG